MTKRWRIYSHLQPDLSNFQTSWRTFMVNMKVFMLNMKVIAKILKKDLRGTILRTKAGIEKEGTSCSTWSLQDFWQYLWPWARGIVDMVNRAMRSGTVFAKIWSDYGKIGVGFWWTSLLGKPFPPRMFFLVLCRFFAAHVYCTTFFGLTKKSYMTKVIKNASCST